jgi:hypothetical protein
MLGLGAGGATVWRGLVEWKNGGWGMLGGWPWECVPGAAGAAGGRAPRARAGARAPTPRGLPGSVLSRPNSGRQSTNPSASAGVCALTPAKVRV